MDGQHIQAIARNLAQSLRESETAYPFGSDHEVYKVGGKIFAMCTEGPGAPIVTLKSDPEESRVLQLAHSNIKPGWHMNKRHWVSIWPVDLQAPANPDFCQQLIEELVEDAYLRVVYSLPKSVRPLEYRER